MQAYHIFPEAIIRQLPGYNSNNAPAVELSEEQIRSIEQSKETTLRQWHREGLTTVTFAHVTQLVEQSLQQAGIEQADRQFILEYAVQWFQAHPQR